MTAVTAWQAIQPQLREKIGGSFYDVWIRPLGPVQIAEGRFEIYAPSELFRDWVRETIGTSSKVCSRHIKVVVCRCGFFRKKSRERRW